MREDATMYALLWLGLALIALGFTGRLGVELAALLAPRAVQEVG